MKIARFVLKVVALSLAVAAAACCIVAYWDKLANTFCGLKDRVADNSCCCHPSEFDDYADWDE